MTERENKLLSAYLSHKLRLTPANSNDTVVWAEEDCIECGNITWVLQINGFEPGIRITSGELLDFVLTHDVRFTENNNIKFHS